MDTTMSTFVLISCWWQRYMFLLFSYMPEDDPGKGKVQKASSVYFVVFQNRCCVD
jgi:hypothetical protein